MKIEKDSNDEYHSKSSISASGLKKISQKSVYHFLNQKVEETASMKLGTAVHAAILEHDTFYDIYHVIEKINRRTKAGKEEYEKQLELSEGKILLQEDEHTIIKSIVANFKQNKLAKKYTKGEIELSHYLKHDGIDVRVRPDVINHVSGFITDIKTTIDASPKGFLSSVYNQNYHIQAAFYMDMLGVNTFKFVACETKHPYPVVVHTLDEEIIEEGRKKYKQALTDWKNYLKTGKVKLFHSDYVCDDGSFLITRDLWKK